MSKQNSRGTKRGQASDSVVNRLAKMPFMTNDYSGQCVP